MASLPRDAALAAAYLAAYNRLRGAAGVAVGRLWDRVASVEDADTFAELAAAASVAAQTRAAALVDGYLAAMLGLLAGEGTPVGLEDVTGAAVRAGAEPFDVYQRPTITVRAALAAGKQWEDAMAAGRARAVGTAEMDVALTQRAATLQVVESDDRVVGYRRVLTGGSCALCATASTQRYRNGDLMPIHNHCDCGVAPIIGSRDPGNVINRPLLDDLKATGGDYAKDRRLTVDEDGTVRLPDVAVREHGELGPVLTERADDFAGPDDIAA